MKYYHVVKLNIIILFLLFTGCDKQEVNLSDLLQSKQWELFYYKIDKKNHTYYATEYQYRIQFMDNSQIAMFKQSGDVEYGKWFTSNNKILDIGMDNKNVMTGKWEMIEYKIWGYDQDRITFKNDTIEIGVKRY